MAGCESRNFYIPSLEEQKDDQKSELIAKQSSSFRTDIRKRFSFSKRFAEEDFALRPTLGVGTAFKKSFSFQNLIPPACKYEVATFHGRCLQKKAPQRHSSGFWYETVGPAELKRLNKCQLKRQEAIFELHQSELDLIDDLLMVKTIYRDSMKILGLITDKEMEQLFGHLDGLILLHQDLTIILSQQRLRNGMTVRVGRALLNWVPKLLRYVSYCADLVLARSLLDSKKSDSAFSGFLAYCQELPYSRKLGLWNFLDLPRSRLVKYPLLFQNILKNTPVNHDDVPAIEAAIRFVRRTIEQADLQMGQTECREIIKKLCFVSTKQKHPLIFTSTLIHCEGVLKTNQGMRLKVFLFDKILVLTRRVHRQSKQKYKVFQQPMPLSHVSVLDILTDGKSGWGSFRRSHFFQPLKANNCSFKLQVGWGFHCRSYTLHCHNESDKIHWLDCLRSAIESVRSGVSQTGFVVGLSEESEKNVVNRASINRTDSLESNSAQSSKSPS